jgi:hypothetical protein
MNLFRKAFPQADEPSLTDICFNASGDDVDAARDRYEQLAKEKRELNRQLKKLRRDGQSNSPEAYNVESRIRQIEAEMQG